MNDYKAMGSITNQLLEYVNSATKKDTNYEIALMMLKNFKKIKDMNITEISELCYVSPASISRFCKILGFDNFIEFKNTLNTRFVLKDDYSNQLIKDAKNDIKSAYEIYTTSLIQNITYTLENLNNEDVDSIVKKIHLSEKVALFGAQFLYSIAKHFQSKLMLTGKYIEAYPSYNKQLECAKNLNDKSLAIILSVEGSYFFKYMEIIEALKKNGVRVVVITQNLNSKLADVSEDILICGNSNSNNEGRAVALYVIELLIFRYSMLYSN
ncbi:MurR/RpiR family transcriptional regulator [Clostridium intestinale]|uniref:RpiR family transcriptional regulator n=1 Tax=Clostridium intestinale URNW TaxID=1294142 RepID=U2Q1J4_9CLOT|nr:MurR/RpiR family transcriptional regulator [Clostridium intestinale]ERK29919.1 RpiR family transcriptional regulator [Clostridium intestinale URNW]